jgi:tetratricopeptide (TPR) repeat protein
MKMLLLILASTVLLAIAAVAQTTTPSKDAATPTTPELSEEETDRLVQRWEAREKDLRRALKFSEPRERIQALRKLLTDYPEDVEVPRLVDEGILDTYIKYRPQQSKEILAQIAKLLKRVPDNFKTGSGNNPYNQIAVKLLEAGILLDKAEALAAKGLAAFDERKFVQAQETKAEIHAKWIALNKNVASVLHTDSLSEDEMLKMAPAERAKALTTLGRVYLTQGKTVEATRILKEAHAANPGINETNIALAEISARAGDNLATVQYLSSVAVRIPLKPELRRQLETAYRHTNQGSLNGLEGMLDSKYRLLMPNPIKVEPYKPTPSRTDRLVLAEVFTGAGCVPCVGADLAFEAAMERYSNRNVALLMYHLHRPLPDPMVNPAALARASFYGIERTPGFAIDGEKDAKGGALREKARLVYDRIQPVIDKRLETPAEADIMLDAVLDGSTVKVKATVDKVGANSKSPRLRIALVENELRYSGENLVRIHPMVVRSLSGAFAVKSSGTTKVEYTFDVEKIATELKAYLDDYELNGDYGPISFKEKKYRIDRMNLSVVALVEEENTKKVLQAAYFSLQPIAANNK